MTAVKEKLKKIANTKAYPLEKGQQQQWVRGTDKWDKVFGFKVNTLWGIAREYGFDTNAGVKELIKHNPHIKNPDKIYDGDKINIPNRWINK
jgi:nucleoid-associated protein YgaU